MTVFSKFLSICLPCTPGMDDYYRYPLLTPSYVMFVLVQILSHIYPNLYNVSKWLDRKAFQGPPACELTHNPKVLFVQGM